MGVSELLLIALVGLALFGGGINVRFKGILRRGEGRELPGGAQPRAQKKPRGLIKKTKG